jgi:hypothetical protein
MHIAVIGAGPVGTALARGWRRTGHEITFGVRDPARAYDPAASVASAARAAATAEVVVLALPWNAAEDAVKSLPLANKVVIDCMNPLGMRDGALSLTVGFAESGAERVAAWSPRARVVKTLNQVGAEILEDARRFARAPAMFVASDDDAAKETTTALVRDLGFEPFDAGALKQARLLEPLAMVWINQALMRGEGRDWTFTVQRASA